MVHGTVRAAPILFPKKIMAFLPDSGKNINVNQLIKTPWAIYRLDIKINLSKFLPISVSRAQFSSIVAQIIC